MSKDPFGNEIPTIAELREMVANRPPSQLDRVEEKLNWLVDNMQAKKKPAEPRSSKKHEYDDKFQAIWEDYPTRNGASKVKAYARYKKRLSETDRPLELAVNIHMAVIKYAEFIQATGTWTKLPETFFGPSKHYLSDWTIPTQSAIPKDDNALAEFAVAQGLHKQGCAPQNIRNNHQYRQWIMERMK